MPKQSPYPHGSVNPPHYPSVAFSFGSVKEGSEAFERYGSRFAYGRMGNPSVRPFEEWFAEFEGTTRGSMWASCSGMAAEKHLFEGITSKALGRGRRIVASRNLYGGTHHLLEFLHRNGMIELNLVSNPFDLRSWGKAIQGRGKMRPAIVFLETPSNPDIGLFDIAKIADIVHWHNSRLVVDNTLGVGLTKPLALGADGVIYSVTKALNRHSSELGGALVVTPEFRAEIETVFDDLFVHSGIIMDPRSALAAFENRTTLERDMRDFSENALTLAKFLLEHSAVKVVHYPYLLDSPHYQLARRQMPDGAGGLLSFELNSYEAAVRFVEEQQAAYLAVHLGDANNDLVTHPASTTHAKLSKEDMRRVGITPELVRASVSIKDRNRFMKEVIAEYLAVLDKLL